MKNLVKSLLCATLLLLAACEDSGTGSNLKEDFDRSGRPHSITVNVYETKRAMQRAKQEASGIPLETDLMGWSEWSPSKEGWGCTIHVTKPKGATDKGTFRTWGHELTHCMYGSFHPEA